jgi:hypothetical protein
MPSDSLTYTDYMLLARWLTGRLEPRIREQKSVSAHTQPRYTPKSETILLDHLRNKGEAL